MTDATQTQPDSLATASLSPSAAPAAQAGASQTSQPADSGQSQTSPPALARPEGISDDLWDAEKGVKVDALLGKFKELEAFKSEAEARRAAVPEKPDGYEFKLPADVKLPEGVELNANDPRLPLVREFAHKAGLSQEQFAGLVALDVQNTQSQMAALKATRDAEAAKLGANASARVDAVVQFVNATAPDADTAKEVVNGLRTARAVTYFEGLIKRQSSQGIDPLRKGGNEPAEDPNKIPGFEKMGFEQRRMQQWARSGQ